MNLRRLHAVLFLVGAAWSSSAHAHGEAMVLGVLLQFGLGGGLLAGILVVALRREHLSFAWPFAALLGILAIVASIWAQSLAAMPYAIAYGAFAAVLPFVLAYYAARYAAVRVRVLWRNRRKPSGSQ
jgi:hypothetical protein